MLKTKADMIQYFKDFNRQDFDMFVNKYYDKDVLFETAGVSIKGSKNLIEYFKKGISTLLSKPITVLNFIKENGLIACEFMIEPDFFFAGFYSLKGDKIIHGRVYRRFPPGAS